MEEESSMNNVGSADNGVDASRGEEESMPEQEPEEEDAGGPDDAEGQNAGQDESADQDEGDAQNEEEEEQQVASFPEEDSMSRDSGAALHGLGDESRGPDHVDEESSDRISEKMDFVDEGQSMDGISLRSEEQSGAENIDSNKDASTEQMEAGVGEESNDSKLSSASKEKDASNENNPSLSLEGEGDSMSNLIANESIMDEEEEENVVAEVDISSMMEINFDEESENSQSNQDIVNTGEEPEVIPIESDDEAENTSTTVQQNGVEKELRQNVDEAIYQVDEHENITEVVEVSVQEDSQESRIESDSSSISSRRPRRAAAEAAAKTIHQISAEEEGIPSNVFRTRRKSQEDREFNIHQERTSESLSQSPTAKQKCLVCKKNVPCSIVVRQYGSDIYLCSNTCFSKFRNQGKETLNKTLPCSKCGLMEGESPNRNTAYFWETMNFCSDLCVGRYQMDVGSKCCTCGSNVSWNSLGKYCVRFGSDIRQFCTPQCLEGYKKNARVCFHCQLDIRRVGNVILANIPSKTSPKEFCSNDCVEMYCDRNVHQPTRAKPIPEHPCSMCQNRRPVYRELALTNGCFKTCSEPCWQDILHAKSVSKAEKCEMCSKFVNMDLGFTTPVYWLSTMQRIYGFCSHVCKNLYILNNRKILSCTSCKVKKYNYDLIEFFTNSSSTYAVCSLACLPKSSDYLKNIRDVLYLPQPTSDRTTLNLGTPVISSVTSAAQPDEGNRSRSRRKQFNGGPGLAGNEIIELDDDDDDSENITIGTSDRILDILSIEEIEAVINFLEKRPKMRDVKCMAKPKTRTVETQTEVSELNEMGRIPLVPDDVVHYVPVPIPTLIHVPFPGYFLEAPCPVPFPIPIPIPIPIPVIIPSKKESATSSDQAAKKGDDDDDNDNNKNDGSGNDPSNNKQQDPNSNTATKETSSHHQSKEQPDRGNNRSKSSEAENTAADDCNNQSKVNKLVAPVSSIPLTPTASLPTTPDFSKREGSSHNFPSPKYSHENAFQPSIYPSPISNYSPTYGSSPVPPLTPVAPIPVAAPPVINHTSPVRDYGTSSVAATPPQMPGGFPPYEVSPRPYMPPSASIIRPPVVPVASGYGTHSSTASMGYSNAHPPSLPLSTIIPQPPSPKNARVENALRAWKMMFGPSSDPRSLSSIELSSKLCDLVNRGSKPNGERYRADILLYISLGIQQLLRDNSRVDKIFYDNMYYNFVLAFTDRAERELTVGIHAKLEEIHFWDTSELGATSPGVLLFTLIFMLYKHFGLKTWEMHAALQFSNIVVQSRYNHFGRYAKYMTVVGLPGVIPTEIQEDVNAPERCLIKMYEFYCFKSETQVGSFYKCLRQDYTPRTPWFTSQPLDQRHIYQMLVRASMISNNESFS